MGVPIPFFFWRLLNSHNCCCIDIQCASGLILQMQEEGIAFQGIHQLLIQLLLLSVNVPGEWSIQIFVPFVDPPPQATHSHVEQTKVRVALGGGWHWEMVVWNEDTLGFRV